MHWQTEAMNWKKELAGRQIMGGGAGEAVGEAEAASGLSGPVGGEGPCVLYDSGGTTVVGAESGFLFLPHGNEVSFAGAAQWPVGLGGAGTKQCW